MSRIIAVAGLICLLFSASIVQATVLDANRIVQEADKIRYPKESFKIMAEMVTLDDGNKEVLRFKIFSKGPGKVLAEFTYPKREDGKAVLLVGDNMWMYLPSLKKALRVSPTQQLLSSNFSNGDVLRINFADDYTARLAATRRLEGHDVYCLELTAKKKGATYQKVMYWVRKNTYMPVKAEFFSASGILLKVLNFVKFAIMAGRERPVEMTMVNPLKKKAISTMYFRKIETVSIPDGRFNPNWLGK